MPIGPRRPPPIDQSHLSDIFVTGFDVHDWEDWLRLVCWVDLVEPDGDGGRIVRRQQAAIVMPRSAVYGLIELAHHPTPDRRHS